MEEYVCLNCGKSFTAKKVQRENFAVKNVQMNIVKGDQMRKILKIE